ncbi:MAG TPA: CpsD/CapB family tyrosine-protein kinase [Tepidisphaeraceae bacterium]|nr:CpsD/CapB family tyrosine-protein kinase [Tepidisphaeraceae bacterium]
MSRVHDALRRGQQGLPEPPAQPEHGAASGRVSETRAGTGLLNQVRSVPFLPARDALLIKGPRDHGIDAPVEEFRSLRTRLNHLQGQHPLHTLVITSPSPAEGKSFTAANLAIAQAHLKGNLTLLADFDCRRPTLHKFFSIDRSPGITDYLLGQATLPQILVKIEDLDLYVMPAGTAVVNPLELLNLEEVRVLLQRLPEVFRWVIMDSPPLLFAADANLLSTYSDATLLVTRIGATTIQNLARAIQGMSHNNIIGVVANGARRGELYNKYGYPYYYYGERRRSGGDEVLLSEMPADAGLPAGRREPDDAAK